MFGLMAEMRSLRQAIEELRGERERKQKELALECSVLDLKRQISDLEISKSKKQEEHDKQERELRHMIGLEKKRQEFEIENAKKETSLTVREGNLTAEKTRFEEQLKFNSERFEKMEGYLKELMEKVMDRLPTVTVDKKVK